jgi:hypothetical protein
MFANGYHRDDTGIEYHWYTEDRPHLMQQVVMMTARGGRSEAKIEYVVSDGDRLDLDPDTIIKRAQREAFFALCEGAERENKPAVHRHLVNMARAVLA